MSEEIAPPEVQAEQALASVRVAPLAFGWIDTIDAVADAAAVMRAELARLRERLRASWVLLDAGQRMIAYYVAYFVAVAILGALRRRAVAHAG